MAPSDHHPQSHVVVVTGISGYVGSHVAKQLLEKGYHVKGTVRSTKNTEKVQFMKDLAAALPGTLELVEGDVMTPGGFDEACKGADYVLHTASPFKFNVDDPQKDLLDVAKEGTRNVLNSAAKSKDTVKRVVVTSSFAAIRSGKKPAKPVNGKLYTEEDWNKSSTIEDEPYLLSKRLAEEEAWSISKEKGLNLVSICPVFVVGPVLGGRVDGTSIGQMRDFMESKTQEFVPRIIDVRDVAKAHVCAIEDRYANGRYLLGVAESVTAKQVADMLRERFPGLQFPEGKDGKRETIMDNSKALKLIGSLIPPQTSIIDMALTLMCKGIAKPQAK